MIKFIGYLVKFGAGFFEFITLSRQLVLLLLLTAFEGLALKLKLSHLLSEQLLRLVNLQLLVAEQLLILMHTSLHGLQLLLQYL